MIGHNRILGYCYAIILSLWSMALSPGVLSGIGTGLQRTASSGEKVESLVQPDHLYLVSQGTVYNSLFRVNVAPFLDRFFNEHTFQFLFLRNACVVAFARTAATDVRFEFIDLIFPYHYFW